MSVAELTWAEIAPMIRAADLPDRTYRVHPLGQEVGAFLRALRVGGREKSTRDAYEYALRFLVLDHADFPSLESFAGPKGTELLYDFLDRHWKDAEKATIAARIGALHSFFKWATITGKISSDPSLPIKAPRRSRRASRRAHALAEIRRIASSQDSLRDEAALLLMGRLGLRKMELGNLRVRDIDLAHDLIYVRRAKGGKTAEMPIEYEDVRVALSLWLSEPLAGTGGSRHPDEFLLGPRGNPRRAPNPATVHRWFKRCLEKARAEDFPMHELRHSAGDHLWRKSGDLMAAKNLLRHESVSTTEAYLHPSSEDLRIRMRSAEES